MKPNLIKSVLSNLPIKNLYKIKNIKNSIFHSFFIKNYHKCHTCFNTDRNNLKKCICSKIFCIKCLEEGKNKTCIVDCYTLDNGTNETSSYFNISKYPLPKNFIAKVYYNYVEMIRTGITYDKEVTSLKRDENSPDYDINYLLEDTQLYETNRHWIFHHKGFFTSGDTITVQLKDGVLNYYKNDEDLKINYHIKWKEHYTDMYLIIHERNNRKKAAYVKYILNLDY